jgi:death on curing protein
MLRRLKNSLEDSEGEVTFLTLEQILLIHQDQIDRYGGSEGLRNLPLLESAIQRPQTTFSGNELYPTVFDKAAALMHLLILNHPFVDGNKRCGITAGLVFLELNGWRVKVVPKTIVPLVIRVATKKMNIDKLARWLELHSVRIKSRVR